MGRRRSARTLRRALRCSRDGRRTASRGHTARALRKGAQRRGDQRPPSEAAPRLPPPTSGTETGRSFRIAPFHRRSRRPALAFAGAIGTAAALGRDRLVNVQRTPVPAVRERVGLPSSGGGCSPSNCRCSGARGHSHDCSPRRLRTSAISMADHRGVTPAVEGQAGCVVPGRRA